MYHHQINALTIDLEDWYQGLTSTSRQIEKWESFEDRLLLSSQRLLDILDESNTKATFFVLGYAAQKHPEIIYRIACKGHEIGLHGYYHQRVDTLKPDDFRQEVTHGRQVVEQASGSLVKGYRAPMFSIKPSCLWALEILHELGFDYDSSIFPIHNPWYGIPRAPRFPYHPFNDEFAEFPLSTVRLLGINLPVAGGFYLRLLPYPLFKGALKRIQREGKPAIIYLHPWDLDANQPSPHPTLRERLTHYTNLRTCESKMRALLKDFKFAPLRELLRVMHGNS